MLNGTEQVHRLGVAPLQVGIILADLWMGGTGRVKYVDHGVTKPVDQRSAVGIGGMVRQFGPIGRLKNRIVVGVARIPPVKIGLVNERTGSKCREPGAADYF